MEKLQALLFVLTLPALLALPLVEESSAKPTDNLQVHPLAASENKTTDKSDESTEVTYVEQTFIEVLVPGSPKLNSTAIASLLNGTEKSDRPTRGIYQDSTSESSSSSENGKQESSSHASLTSQQETFNQDSSSETPLIKPHVSSSSTYSSTARTVRDTSSENSSKESTTTANTDKLKRQYDGDDDDDDDDSNESGSEENSSEESSSEYRSRVVRDEESVKREPARGATGGTVDADKSATSGSVVYVTPKKVVE